MTIVGFNFTRILAEKKYNPSGKINIANNVAIKNVVEEKLALGNQKAYKISFTYTSKYEPEVGNIDISGNTIYILDKKNEKLDLLKSWKKDKMLPEEITKEILNATLRRCCVEALLVARDVNLPSPVPMPGVDVKKK